MSDTLMAVVDTLFVSRLGTDALAGIGLAISGSHLVHAFGWGMVMAVRVAVSQRVGAGDAEGARRLGWQGFWLALGLGAVAWACLPLGPLAFGHLTDDAGVAAHASAFFLLRVAAAPLFFGSIALGGWFQGRGDTRSPMVGTLLANALNLALNPLFIFGWGPVPAMGTAGAALATAISLGVNTLWLGLRFWSASGRTFARPDRALLGELRRFGVPMGLNQLQDIGSFSVFMGFLASCGAAHIAAHVLIVRCVMMSFLPGWAIGEAGGVLVGQAVGAGRRDLARQAWATATGLALALMTAWGVAFVAFPDLFLGLFHPDPEVAALGRRLLWIAAAFQVFDAIATVGFCALNAAGDNRFSTAINVVLAWGVKIPLAWALAVPAGLGVVGAWLGMTGEIIGVALLCLYRIGLGGWIPQPTPKPEVVTAELVVA